MQGAKGKQRVKCCTMIHHAVGSPSRGNSNTMQIARHAQNNRNHSRAPGACAKSSVRLLPCETSIGGVISASRTIVGANTGTGPADSSGCSWGAASAPRANAAAFETTVSSFAAAPSGYESKSSGEGAFPSSCNAPAAPAQQGSHLVWCQCTLRRAAKPTPGTKAAILADVCMLPFVCRA